MNCELLSIIIPAYNTETVTVKKCIDSVLKIQNINFKIYFIDDGSDEKKGDCYREIIKNNNEKAEYFQISNSGVSFARNYGLLQASGRYVMFVDSDDTIDATAIVPDDFSTDADIIVYDTDFIKNGIHHLSCEFDHSEGMVDGMTLISEFIQKKSMHRPCAKLYKKKKIIDANIEFPIDFIHGEDAMFNLSLFAQAPIIYYTRRLLYIYNYSPSTTEKRWLTKTKKIAENTMQLYIAKMNLLKKTFFNDKDRCFFESVLYSQLVDDFFTARMILNGTLLLTQINDEIKYQVRYENCTNKKTMKTRLKKALLLFDNNYLFSVLTLIRKFKNRKSVNAE